MNWIKKIGITFLVLVLVGLITVYRVPAAHFFEAEKLPSNIKLSELQGSLLEGKVHAWIALEHSAFADIDMDVEWHWCPKFTQLAQYCISAQETRFFLDAKAYPSNNKLVLDNSFFKLKTLQLSVPVLNLLDVTGEFDIISLKLDLRQKNRKMIQNLNIVSQKVLFNLDKIELDSGSAQIVYLQSQQLTTLVFEGKKINVSSEINDKGFVKTHMVRVANADSMPTLFNLFFDSKGEYQVKSRIIGW